MCEEATEEKPIKKGRDGKKVKRKGALARGIGQMLVLLTTNCYLYLGVGGHYSFWAA